MTIALLGVSPLGTVSVHTRLYPVVYEGLGFQVASVPVAQWHYLRVCP